MELHYELYGHPLKSFIIIITDFQKMLGKDCLLESDLDGRSHFKNELLYIYKVGC